MRRQQQQQTPRPPPSRRRPAWNSYLTDDAQYRLNEYQQLQRQLQQLSTAHFSSRSPSSASHQQRQAPATTPSRYNNNNNSNNSSNSTSNSNNSTRYAPNDVSIASASSTPMSAFAAGRERPGSGDSVRQRKAGVTVSFKLDHDEQPKLDRSQKVNLQGELAVLERMLFELEAETATLNQEEDAKVVNQASMYPHQQMQRAGSPPNQEEVYTFDGHVNDYFDDESDDAGEEVRRAGSEGYNDDDEDGSESDNEGERLFEARRMQQTRDSREEKVGDAVQDASSASLEATQLSQVCYKSLSIGMHLAKKMDQLSRELDVERKMRMDHELKIEVLEQEVRSTRAKCNYIDVKYQSVLSQVDDMREALIATEEAVHRLTKQAVERTHRSKSSHRPPPSTLNTPKATEVLKQINGFHEFEEEQTPRSRSAATPKRSPKADTSFVRRERKEQHRRQQQENDASFVNASEPHQNGPHR